MKDKKYWIEQLDRLGLIFIGFFVGGLMGLGMESYIVPIVVGLVFSLLLIFVIFIIKNLEETAQPKVQKR